MLTKMNFKQELLKEIKGLTQSDIARIVKMIHFVKKEILGRNKEDAKLQIMGNAGMLKNMTDEETELFNEAVKRKSLFRHRAVRL
jgi:hypothetical protein